METQGRPEPHTKKFGENIESDLALEFLRVVENAAIESARTTRRNSSARSLSIFSPNFFVCGSGRPWVSINAS
ncbi:MAG: hypothetical protein ABSA27_02885 [Terriglobales bacterium]